ncbi:MAG TPA: alpha/beta fold hydrolase [Streptosporangiaceae bacterium]|jgi:pimeloyl-ACP methyl ester carboxylesterase
MTIPDAQRPEQSTPMATEDLTLPLDGGAIHISQDGPRDAPALLLIHGSASSTRSWDALVPLLTESHRLIRIDLLGHGESAKPSNGDYAIPTQAHRAGVILDRLGITKAIVVAHSSGGLTATALAEHRPDLVKALSLINTGPRMEAVIPQDLSITPEQWPHLTDTQLREAASTAFTRPGYDPPQFILDDIRKMTFHTFTTTMHESAKYLSDNPIPPRLSSLSLPLQVIFGESDRRWNSSHATEYQAVPNTHLNLLPGIGHTPILESPPETAALLLAFTTSL